MINNRLMHHLAQSGRSNPAFTGFRPLLSTNNYLRLIRRVINRTARTAFPDYVVALDIQKALENVSQLATLQEFASAFPNPNAQYFVPNFLHHQPIRLSSTRQPITYYLDRGVPQGLILLAILFNLDKNLVARTLDQDTFVLFVFHEDDVVFWT